MIKNLPSIFSNSFYLPAFITCLLLTFNRAEAQTASESMKLESNVNGVLTFSHPKVGVVTYLGESRPLRDLPPAPEPTQEELNAPPKEHDNASLERHMPIVNPDALPHGEDPALQKFYPQQNRSRGNNRVDSATIITSWAGMTANIYPSDNTIAVGLNHVVQMVNAPSSTYLKVWSKTGTVLRNAVLVSTLINNWTVDYGDPNIIYDQIADRWIFVLLYDGTSNKLLICVSTTNDPTGTWKYYSLNTANGFPDYPKIGMWGSSYYITTNSNTPEIHVLCRDSVLNGGTNNLTERAWALSRFPTIGFQSASPITQTGAFPPPPGSPAIVIRVGDDAWGTSVGTDHLELFKLNDNWGTGVHTLSGVIKLNTIAYNSDLGCGIGSGNCIPMPGTSTKLDPLSDIVMDKVQYRYVAGTIESIVCSHVCNADGNGTAGVRWYELRKDTTNNWYIYQQSTYSQGTNGRFMSSISINDDGQIALGYNISSSTVYPGIRFTGRNICDSLNTMTFPETVVRNGTASNIGVSRYGDYNALVADPTDGSFWMTSNYNPSSTWGTYIAHFKFSACSVTPIANFTVSKSSGCDSICVTFADGSFNDTAAIWSFPGGTPSSSTLSSPSVCYASPGTYSVSLIALNSYGADTLTNPAAVIVTATTIPIVTLVNDTLTSTAGATYQWYKSSTTISGATGQRYIAATTGYYHVCVKDANGCRTCSDSIHYINPAGVNDLPFDNELKIYPNPASKGGTIMTISMEKELKNGEVAVYNVIGEAVYIDGFKGREKTFNLSLNAGIYFLRVRDGGLMTVRKIVIE